MAPKKGSKAAQVAADVEDDPDMPVFFYRTQEIPYGIFSQWYMAHFSVSNPQMHFAYLASTRTDASLDDVATKALVENMKGSKGFTFTGAEQYMMYAKAVYFGDGDVAYKIMKTGDPKGQKSLGRSIKSFSDPEWLLVREKIGEEANVAKFGGDEAMKKTLLGTGDKGIYEASTRDNVWGIGFSEGIARNMYADGTTEAWGENILGKSLVKARTRLRAERNT